MTHSTLVAFFLSMLERKSGKSSSYSLIFTFNMADLAKQLFRQNMKQVLSIFGQCYGLVLLGVVWCGFVSYGMVWYGMIWFELLWLNCGL